jgi:hypothetical protein
VCTAKYALKEKPPMALSQSVVSELLDAFRSGDGVDLSIAPVSVGHRIEEASIGARDGERRRG